MSMFKLDDTEAAENVYYFGVLRFRLLMCDHELFSRHSHTLRPFYVRAMRAAQSFFFMRHRRVDAKRGANAQLCKCKQLKLS